MGVYNPMAKMPDNCAVCREECRYRNITAHKRHKRCPLIDIKTPHGRLIDADAIDYDNYGKQGFTNRECVVSLIINAEQPTVIEAEAE